MGQDAEHSTDNSTPLFSSLLGEADGPDLIEYFLAELRPQVCAIRSALKERNLTELHRIGSQLGGAASGFGFDPIGEAALELQAGSDDPEKDFDALREQANRLIELCQRASTGV